MVNIVILSLVTDSDSFETTFNCVESYAKSELVTKIIVVESNKSFNNLGFKYNNKVQLIIPQEEFNYNRFLNIGKSNCTSDFIVFSNNDLVVEDDCIQQLYSQLLADDQLMSVCPIDRNWHRHTKTYLPTNNKLYTGYVSALHMFGCCYMLKKTIFDIIGDFDERFFFFYQDDDLATSLKRNNIKHGVLTSAKIKHKISKKPQPDGGEKFRYTNHNMVSQGDIYMGKWSKEEPFKSGGYSKFKSNYQK